MRLGKKHMNYLHVYTKRFKSFNFDNSLCSFIQYVLMFK